MRPWLTPCQVEGCTEKVKARGLCELHYRRIQKRAQRAGASMQQELNKRPQLQETTMKRAIPDPRERVWLVVHGYHHGPFSRSYAEGLRRCFCSHLNAAQAEIKPMGEPVPKANRVPAHIPYVKFGAVSGAGA